MIIYLWYETMRQATPLNKLDPFLLDMFPK